MARRYLPLPPPITATTNATTTTHHRHHQRHHHHPPPPPTTHHDHHHSQVRQTRSSRSSLAISIDSKELLNAWSQRLTNRTAFQNTAFDFEKVAESLERSLQVSGWVVEWVGARVGLVVDFEKLAEGLERAPQVGGWLGSILLRLPIVLPEFLLLLTITSVLLLASHARA